MQLIKWTLFILMLFSSTAGAVLPSEADYILLKQDITVTNQAEFAASVSANDDAPIVAAYNALQSPSFWVWKTLLFEQEVYEATVETLKWSWATYKAQTVQDRDSWIAMWHPGRVNPSLQQTRDGWAAIFGGQGASQIQVNYLLALGRRSARRIETLLSSGTGSTAAPAVMRYEGTITTWDIAHALRGTPLP